MKNNFSDKELRPVKAIIAALTQERIAHGLRKLQTLKDDTYAAIPAKERGSRGITWVLQRISDMVIQVCQKDEDLKALSLTLYERLEKSDLLIGVPIFLTAEYGKRHLAEVFEFFEQAADARDWVVRELAAAGFRQVIGPNKAVVLPWLKKYAQAASPNVRRFASETLRPVTVNKWLNQEPDYSLGVLRLMFREAHPYPRTSVGNNLSDLSRRQPELIFSVVEELVELGDKNSYWIAHRACRNLVKKQPERVMAMLGVGEYHYKDRNFVSIQPAQGKA